MYKAAKFFTWSFPEEKDFVIENSGITVQLSSRTEGFSSDNFNKEYLECRGLIPDYWATTDSELEETLEYFCK